MYDSMGVQGMLSCGATANHNWNIDEVGDVPTACPSDYMIAVTNTTRNDNKNSGAAWGPTTIDLGAPGTSILSTDVGSNYSNKTGTSMATPMVAGAIALMFAAADSTWIELYMNNPSSGAIAFRDVLFEAVDPIPDLQGTTVTGGRLNVYNAALTISDPVVPVELVNFIAEVHNNSVQLKWFTSTETNNSGFEILRNTKNSSAEWFNIGFKQGYGTTTEPQLYSFTDENLQPGIYHYRLKQIDFDGTYEYSNIIEVEVAAPTKFSLQQNYPNPFNPTTVIRYSVSSKQLVSLKVYDVLGNEVASIINREVPPGDYEVEFNASGLVSGVYFYTLSAGEFVDSKRMLLLK
jgi:hypothetical protein